MADAKPLKKKEARTRQYELLRSQLELERSSFLSHWKDLGEHILPRRPRFNVFDVNRGDRRNQKVIDSTPTMAARTLRSGMMGGITSPARPWFQLTVSEPEIAEQEDVRDWLWLVTKRMSNVFLRSNLYNALPIVYGDMGVFGTAAVIIEEDFDQVIRVFPFPIGSYLIANDDKMRVRVFMRYFRLTVRQLVEKFGQLDVNGEIVNKENFSQSVLDSWREGHLERWVEVRHVIMPNKFHDKSKIGAKYKKFISAYYEVGQSGTSMGVQTGNFTMQADPDKLLRESGYDRFPVLGIRWEVNAEDVYATDCPGMTALGDIRQLQVGEKRGAQATEKMLTPPLKGPPELMNAKVSLLPGDMTYTQEREGMKGLSPIHEVNFAIDKHEMKQEAIRQRIRRAFYEDLFLMLTQDERNQPPTATEVVERHEEKLLALGPVLEQLNQDLLDPLIEITFEMMQRQGLIPPPPPALKGQQITVQYVSVMAEAQKLVGVSGMERLAGFVTQLASVDPTVLDKIDTDELIAAYGEATSAPPKVIRSQDSVDSIRSTRAQAQKAQADAETANKATSAIKNLSASDTGGNNALAGLLQQAKAGQVVPTP